MQQAKYVITKVKTPQKWGSTFMVMGLEQEDLEQKQKQRKKDGNYINHKVTNRGNTITHMRKERRTRMC